MRDYGRWSIYPRIPKPKEYESLRLKPGDILTVEVSDIDDSGRGVARYKGYVIRINGGATVGDKAKVRLVRIRGLEALAELLNVE